MSNLQIFNYNGKEVRTVEKDGEPWWVLKDVCEVLNLDTSKIKQVSDRLDEDEKDRYSIPTPGGSQETWIIDESGLYHVILRSDKPEAKPFRRWVTSKVLPAIRKTGTYSVKGYQPKATSLGEVASFIKVMRGIMKENGQCAEKISEMAETVCKQFNVELPSGFTKRDPFQMQITGMFLLTQN